jgi:ribose 1,5-bisphosphokinase
MMPGAGCFVCVVGPSGVGKDTLIGLARKSLAGEKGFFFVRRLVTRPPGAFEDHDTIAEPEFKTKSETGGFSLSWRAHGLGYAVPNDVKKAVDEGLVAVCNLSRTAIDAARALFPRVAVVRIEASPDVIAARLAARGREGGELIAARIERATDSKAFAADYRITNDGRAEDAAAEFIRCLRQIREGREYPPSDSRETPQKL